MSRVFRPVGDLVLAGEPDARLALRVGEEAIEDAHAIGVAGNTVVERHHHHPALGRAFLVELVEFVLQRLLVGGRVIALEREGHDVVHVEGVRHGDEVAALDRQDERLVHAGFVQIVGEAEPP